MTTHPWPTGLEPSACSVRLTTNKREFTSQYSGAYQAVDLFGERFQMAIRLPATDEVNSSLREALFNALAGSDFVLAWHFKRPVPLGTMRGTPALNAPSLQGSKTLSISGASPGATLLPGDMLGVSGQLYQVAYPSAIVFNGSGIASVPVVNRVTPVAGLPNGAAVTWNRPSVAWRLASAVAVEYEIGRYSEPLDLDLIQV